MSLSTLVHAFLRLHLRFQNSLYRKRSIYLSPAYGTLPAGGADRRFSSPLCSRCLHRLLQLFLVISKQSMSLAVRFVADRVNLLSKLLPRSARILIEQHLNLIVVFLKQSPDLPLLFRSQLQIFREARKFLGRSIAAYGYAEAVDALKDLPWKLTSCLYEERGPLRAVVSPPGAESKCTYESCSWFEWSSPPTQARAQTGECGKRATHLLQQV